MKVLFVSRRGPTNYNRKGGAQEYISHVANCLQAKGCEVLILCGNEKLDGKYFPLAENVNNINVQRLESSSSKKLLNKALEIEKDFDIIIENIMAYSINLPLHLSKKKKFFAIRHHLEKKNFFKLQGPIKGMYGLLLEAIIEPFVYRNVNFFAASILTKKNINNRWLKPKSITVANPGINSIKKTDLQKERAPTIFFVGHLVSARKRVEDLIAAYKIVIKKNSSVKLWIAGDGPDKEPLINMSRGLNIEFFGFLSEEKKHELYQRAWIFASPSLTEGFGITWIEANAHGLPVVVYELGLDTVNKSCAMIVKIGDVEKIAEALIILIENKVLRIKMGKAGKENAKRFSWEATSQVFLNTFKHE